MSARRSLAKYDYRYFLKSVTGGFFRNRSDELTGESRLIGDIQQLLYGVKSGCILILRRNQTDQYNGIYRNICGHVRCRAYGDLTFKPTANSILNICLTIMLLIKAIRAGFAISFWISQRRFIGL